MDILPDILKAVDREKNSNNHNQADNILITAASPRKFIDEQDGRGKEGNSPLYPSCMRGRLEELYFIHSLKGWNPGPRKDNVIYSLGLFLPINLRYIYNIPHIYFVTYIFIEYTGCVQPTRKLLERLVTHCRKNKLFV